VTDEAVLSDPVVETALRLLPVPDHAPGFWSALGTRLTAEATPPTHEPALAVGPRLVAAPLATIDPLDAVTAAERAEVAALEAAVAVPAARRSASDPSLLLVPPALRRRSNAVLSMVAVAAAAVVVVAGSALVQQRSSVGVGTPASAVGTPVSTAAATASARDEAASTEAVLAWVAAMAAGDTERAWDLLGPASKAHFGSRAAFAAQGTAGADYAAWASSAPDDAVVMTVPSQGAQVLVVTLVGSAERDGVRHWWAEAVPVRLVDGNRVVEPYAFAGEIDVEVPGAGLAAEPLPVVSADDELVVIVPRGVDAPALSLDGHAPVICGAAAGTTLTQLEDAPGQRCTYRPAKGFAPGRSMLTVAFVAPDGLGIAAESVMFEAA